ncbi:MAG: fumarylacetoacetate hydrolase family protein [Bacteroidota bacterium]
MNEISPIDILPEDGFSGSLIGRVWRPAPHHGPSPVWIDAGGVFDLSPIAPSVSQLLNQGFSATQFSAETYERIGSLDQILQNSLTADRQTDQAYFLSPFDLQAIKACGVTFMVSMMERVIEEQAGGDPKRAAQIRHNIQERIGQSLSEIVPGSAEAELVKQMLQAEGLWSQYLEVGIGPYAEIFTKAQPLSSVGLGAQIGIPDFSNWNNPEPEIVLAVNAKGEIVGASLGNDVNLRDIEGRSALLLGKAKDNNASCAIGPFIRLIDESFSLDDLRQAQLKLRVEHADGFCMEDSSDMQKISRDILDLVAQTTQSHQYPDGFALFTGTLFAPIQDRFQPGEGFTHQLDDRVSISSPKLGMLVNQVGNCQQIPQWEFGIATLMQNLAKRGLL